MLSDFDLAKQSTYPGGKPAMIHQSEPNGVCLSSISYFGRMADFWMRLLRYLSLIPCLVQGTFGQIHLLALKVRVSPPRLVNHY
jgi:hypothetical protein